MSFILTRYMISLAFFWGASYCVMASNLNDQAIFNELDSYGTTLISPFTLGPYLITQSVKQGGIKYHFLSLWYDSTWDWIQVYWWTLKPICQLAGIYIYIYMCVCVCVCVCIYLYIYIQVVLESNVLDNLFLRFTLLIRISNQQY